MSWQRMQILAEQVGYKYDSLQTDGTSVTLVLASMPGEEDLCFKAETAEAAVETACDRLAVIVGCVEEATS